MESEWCYLIFLLPSVVLQSSSFCSPYWINYKSDNSTAECFRGVFYNSGCSLGVQWLGATVFGLQATSFAIIFLTTLASIRFICCNRNDDDDDVGCCDIFGGCMLCLYPVAGIIGFSGCMVVVADFGDYDKGWAFYVSLTASCYVILQLILCCCLLCKKKRIWGGSGESGTGSDAIHLVVAGRGGSGDGAHQIGISSTGELIVRKLQFTRISTSVKPYKCNVADIS
uniref:Uncharacterized protein LOC111101900 n=1 Tax=Crassostrea virginica TaxID=6565 RepID=A0A8B8AFJ7_CRAVI|nr:uncharacterized protein LOC111101900 [Crassostrea virginica]